MSNPTRQEIISAHEALEELRNWAYEWVGTRAHSRYGAIRDVLPPKPQPTMADVEWDDDEHYLAEAESDLFGTVIMLAKNEDGHIEFLVPEGKSSRTDESLTRTLTPTGKRYTLTEVHDD